MTIKNGRDHCSAATAIKNGKLQITNNFNNNSTDRNGGGLFVDSEEIILAHNEIVNNTAANEGGGACVFNSERRLRVITIDENLITNNEGEFGGGIHVNGGEFIGTLTFTNNNISFNNADISAGAHILDPGRVINFRSNLISDNINGGGVYIDGPQDRMDFIQNVLKNNTGTNYGALSVYNSEVAVFSNNEIGNNSTVNGGGGISLKYCRTVTLTNNSIYNNGTNSSGGGLWIQYTHNVGGSVVNLINNTFTGNSASSNGGGVFLYFLLEASIANFYNNIIWNNTSSMGADIYLVNDGYNNYIPSPIAIYNNDFNKTPSDGIWMQRVFTIDISNLNNIDPLFVNPTNDDYHLNAGSQCIDAGNNSAPELPDLDKDGNPRVMNGIVDIGAYEYPGAALPIIDSFVAFPTSGEAPLPVALTCVAHDYSGSIETYTIDFGDGSSQSNANGIFDYDYVTPGTFDATCTAVDNDGESAISDPVTIAVTTHVNLPPVADCGQERAVVFNEIIFDGTGSTDPDGTIKSYEWTLQHEDGSVITAFGPNPTVPNLPPGFYDVTLKVFDDQDAFRTDTMLLAAAGSCYCTPTSIHVESITLTTVKGSKGRSYGQATVLVTDDCGGPVPGVTVEGHFEGDFNDDNLSGVTGADGSVIFTT